MSVPTFTQSPNSNQQPRQARRRIWMTLGIVASLIVIVIVAFSALVATGVFVGLKEVSNRTDQPGLAAANYGLAFMSQNYAKAYTDLDSQATINSQRVDQQSFTTLATTADTQYGTVSQWNIDPALQGNDPSHLTVTFHRGDRTYQVHLQLKLEGSSWKIISADGI